MKKKKLPRFSVSGTIQQLIELETLLCLSGYSKNDEEWNNNVVENKEAYSPTHIILSEKGTATYHNHSGTNTTAIFKASQVKEILLFIEKPN